MGSRKDSQDTTPVADRIGLVDSRLSRLQGDLRLTKAVKAQRSLVLHGGMRMAEIEECIHEKWGELFQCKLLTAPMSVTDMVLFRCIVYKQSKGAPPPMDVPGEDDRYFLVEEDFSGTTAAGFLVILTRSRLEHTVIEYLEALEDKVAEIVGQFRGRMGTKQLVVVFQRTRKSSNYLSQRNLQRIGSFRFKRYPHTPDELLHWAKRYWTTKPDPRRGRRRR